MQPAIRTYARSLLDTFSAKYPRELKPSIGILSGTQSQWTCAECRFKLQTRGFQTRRGSQPLELQQRNLSVTIRRREDDATRKHASSTETSTAHEPRTAASTSTLLPSHVDKRRWQFSRDMTRFVDRLLARASVAGQHINVYTGTDYSGIESLRKEIIAQEQKVKDDHRAADEAKMEHHEAVAKQAASQKEIVSLLERKSSWSPTDLERYMSLVRFEHTDDQSVQVAKERLFSADRQLEDTRSLLEKLERKQYHEEQVWSDTIRRNSTWVTFGLMGVNIILLLAQILVFEPYRRRRIVRDMKAALDEKTLHALPPVPDKQVEPSTPVVEAANLEGLQSPVEVWGGQSFTQLTNDSALEEAAVGDDVVATGEMLPEEASAILEPGAIEIPGRTSSLEDQGTWEVYQARLRDLFSDRLVQVKQVEMTTVALQGAATGVAVMGMLFVLLRPR